MADVKIAVADNGPFRITGDVSIVDAEGGEFPAEQKVIALCRCGASENQPFCTGNHKQIDFQSAPRASEAS
ncbi:CDGSH iron-sulfur domain-containing protein [Romeria aff. gracilis LEGE 07310]|uniref:CDGSH iron-sulfur domain-containing protein n=1 Tax=Vasconcelosia minhoensis LEGE 07310 TaxID=915328 RepID=A0A8J7DRE3_9CYAN|nr:CDGSH iron-sulfur domain-containing protein [Romeria gracilis]MBE9078319.1 CDGSH iron-sulfur domain-containing protein [Romeria aff. gracilis LEGE 07310]